MPTATIGRPEAPPRPAAPGRAAVARHRALVDDALTSGDPNRIKRLYVDLGSDLARSCHDIDDVPQLSVHETVGVVDGLLGEVHGLILDAGCGPNPATAIRLAAGRDDRSMVLMDIGEGTVTLARRVAAAHGLDAPAVVGDLEALPFRPGAFDAFVSDDTIEHVPDDAAAVGELARVLADDGVGVLATPNRWNLQVLVRKTRDRLAGRRHPARHYFVVASHLREYTWRELSALTRPVFHHDRSAAVPWPGRSVLRRLLSALARLPGIRLVSRVVVVRVTPRR